MSISFEDDDARRCRHPPRRRSSSRTAALQAAAAARSHRAGGPIILRHIAILLFLLASARDDDVCASPLPAAVEAFSIAPSSVVGSPTTRTVARMLSRTAVLGATTGTASSSTTEATTTSTSTTRAVVGRRMRINENHPGLKLVHADPDVYVIESFLDPDSCDDLMRRAAEKGTIRSPVAYAGWTDDLKDLVGLAASGPVTWIALFGAWYEAQGDGDGGPSSVASLVVHALRNYAVTFVVAVAAISAFIKSRADGLGELRTSTSTTLDDLNQRGAREFVLRASELFDHAYSTSPSPTSSSSTTDTNHPASYFEAPTVIRYETGQALAPHYDANRSADVEDANRGGQTLSTLIVYLNDVPNGGTTRFPKLPPATTGIEHAERHQVQGGTNCLEIVPRKGDALLFFPADECGNFDERTEHEGRPAVDVKWIARIWRHANRVPPPFGLSDDSMRDHL